MCRFAYARTARGGGDLELAPQGFQSYCYFNDEYPKESNQLLTTKAGLLRHKPRNDKFGFTLAEVLITLGIIGVVAALTLPTLIQNYQKQATATSVKKAYNELNQIIDRAKADYGDPSGWDYYGEDELDKWVQTYIEPYVKVVEAGQCGNSGKCLGINPIYHLYHNRGTNSGYKTGGYLIKKTGDSLAFRFYRYGGSFSVDTRVYVYIRNPKYPRSGRDVFYFAYSNDNKNYSFNTLAYDKNRDELLEPGHIYAGECMNTEKFSAGNWMIGDACPTVIMKDGWKIAKDYPW